ncbi:hypothetical protein GCM10022223_13200 [Kineosporia mesophila]|uniref:DprA winged helix domain-containing protein n=1 Tax=Kineosporia mesophila TaxID=566012 RepID=A0ABP6Z7S5_9ACTN|nr:hypothetical protein [Kineosporia mesophila]MCD5354945.1 hypothetical protein [Kineosporia mesophila]
MTRSSIGLISPSGISVISDALDVALGGKTMVDDDLRIARAVPPRPRPSGETRTVPEIIAESGGELTIPQLAEKMDKPMLTVAEIVLELDRLEIVQLDGRPGHESVRLPPR